MDKHEAARLHEELAQQGQEYWTKGIIGRFYNMYVGSTRRFVQSFKGAKILEIGCGEGQMTRGLYQDNEVHQVDISPTLIKKAQAYNPNAIVGDAFDLPYEPGKFDAVLLVAVLEHLPDPHLAIDQAHKVLKKGGKLLILVPNDIWMSVGRMVLLKWPPRYPGHVSFIAPGRMHELLGDKFRVAAETFMPNNPLGFWFNMYYEVVAEKI
jgi:SAM-dependent methyltransferase